MTTVVTPTGNRLPLGGTLVTVTGAQPPAATGAAYETTTPFAVGALTVTSSGQMIVRSGSGSSRSVPGPRCVGCQVWPPSVLNSMNTSKKLAIWNWPPMAEPVTQTRPVEARVGLSRIITPLGRLPPAMFSCSISVSKKRVWPKSVPLLTRQVVDATQA